MSSHRHVLRLLLSVLLPLFFSSQPCISSSSDASNGATSIHDLLRAHGLPAGLLPRTVESYTLNHSTGLLEVFLQQPCYAHYDGLTFFDRVIRGNLSYGELGGVVGLSQEELFLWLPVKGILVTDPSSGVILFDISLAHKRLSLSLFQDPPDCQPQVNQLAVAIQGRKDKGFFSQ